MTRTRGFTLIELAIVLVIVTILIGGLAMPLTAQIQARRIAETKKTLEEAREAIIGYAMTHTTGTCACTYTSTGLETGTSTCLPLTMCPSHPDPLDATSATGTVTLTLQPRHYIPCPDLMENDPEPNLDNDGDGSLRDLNNGREDRYKASGKIGECASRSGNLPWVTLGAGQQDAWGNHLRYVVAEKFANGTSGFVSTDDGDIEICSSSTCTSADAADKIVAAIVSHGPNGWGARSIHGTLLKNPASPDELENTDGDNRLVSRSPTAADSSSGEFDDLVVWISAGQLRGRVCPAGGCP